MIETNDQYLSSYACRTSNSESFLPLCSDTDFLRFSAVQYFTTFSLFFLRKMPLISYTYYVRAYFVRKSQSFLRQLLYFLTLTVLLSLWLLFEDQSLPFDALRTTLFALVLYSVLMVELGVRLDSWLARTRFLDQLLCLSQLSSTILQMRVRYYLRLSLVLSLIQTLIFASHSIMSFLLKNSLRYGCLAISSMLGRFSGLKLRDLQSKSQPSAEQLLTHCFRLIGFILVSSSSISLPKSVFSACRSWMVGGPVQVSTLSI